LTLAIRVLTEACPIRHGNCSLEMNATTAVGLAAAVCTTSSYFPQLRKRWKTGSAGDLSLRMFLVLAAGVALWIGYGFLQSDLVIIVSNSASLAMLSGILYFKVRQIGPSELPARREVLYRRRP
jgi:MtN3 and saliva related transmembrane protein